MPEYKTDQQSISAALRHLVEKCKQIKRADHEAIADAIYVSAVVFDVDESVLNDAWGNLAPQTFLDTPDHDAYRSPRLVSAVHNNVTTKIFLKTDQQR